jgi:hypothetical protein
MKRPASFAAQPLDHRMAAGQDAHLAIIGKRGAM